MLFDEDPTTLIRETTSQFRIAPDRDSLSRIGGSLSHLSSARTAHLAAQQNHLKALARRLNSLQSQQVFEEERHDAGKHAGEMLRMDTEKFRVAKGVSEGEIEVERLGGELEGLKATLAALDREGAEGGKRAGIEQVDELVLKLQFYRGLGIDVSQDPSTGDFNRAIIRNTARGDVNVVNVDGKMSQSYYADMFWDSL